MASLQVHHGPIRLPEAAHGRLADAAALAKFSVTGKLVEHTKGPKIRIHKFKNKTGYHKRQGHRQKLTRVEVTGITGK